MNTTATYPFSEKGFPEMTHSVQCLGHRNHRYQASYKPQCCKVCGGPVASVEINGKANLLKS